MPNSSPTVMELAAQIVAAYVSNHALPSSELPHLIADVAAVMDVGEVKGIAGDLPTPAVPIKKSVFPAYIVCLEDGKKLKMLKRHLQAKYGMTPEQYRERWGLPDHYPMTAPDYAEKRSKLAKSFGLGQARI